LFSPLTNSQKILFEAIKEQDQNTYDFTPDDDHNSMAIKKKLNSFDFGI